MGPSGRAPRRHQAIGRQRCSAHSGRPTLAEARDWLAAHGIRTPRRVRRLPTATTAELFAVDDLVLRWYASGAFLENEPDALAREVAALRALGGTSVPAPALVAWSSDPPAILMTKVSGKHGLDARGPKAVEALLHAIHAVPPTGLARWTYVGYHEGRDLAPPQWWRDPTVWDRAVRLSSDGVPAFEPVLIHRDFHPGNLLWTDTTISGVVDWGNACVGPAAFDLAHYRINVATLVGLDMTDGAFPGVPAWDIEAALGYIDPWAAAARDNWVGPWPHVSPPVARDRVEAFVAKAVASVR